MCAGQMTQAACAGRAASTVIYLQAIHYKLHHKLYIMIFARFCVPVRGSLRPQAELRAWFDEQLGYQPGQQTRIK